MWGHDVAAMDTLNYKLTPNLEERDCHCFKPKKLKDSLSVLLVQGHCAHQAPSHFLHQTFTPYY